MSEGTQVPHAHYWTARFVDGPAAGVEMWRSWDDGAVWLQQTPRGEWSGPPMAMDRVPGASRYVLSEPRSDRAARLLAYEYDAAASGPEGQS
jgi:hypothetical protein